MGVVNGRPDGQLSKGEVIKNKRELESVVCINSAGAFQKEEDGFSGAAVTNVKVHFPTGSHDLWPHEKYNIYRY